MTKLHADREERMRPALQTQGSHFFLAAILAASGLTTLGCDTDSGDVAHGDTEAPLLPAEAALPVPRLERVAMSGTGCPDPSAIYISGRRNTFFAELDDFIVTASAQARESESDCTVSLTLSAPDGVAYAPSGMNVAITTDATSEVVLTTGGTWSSTPDATNSKQTKVSTRGRRTTSRVFDEENLWSSCRGSRELQVQTKLHIRGERGRAGYASIHELSNLQFRAKPCASDEHDAGGPPNGGARGQAASPSPRIDDVSFLGGGCSGANAAAVVWADDRSSFELRFPGFTAQGTSQIQNCTASIELTSPPGYRAAIDSYVLEGESRLPAGATATLDGSYWYPGDFSVSAEDNSQVFAYTGPSQGPFVASARFSSGDVTFGDCNHSRITFSLDAIVGSAAGASARVDVQRLHSLKFKLQACR